MLKLDDKNVSYIIVSAFMGDNDELNLEKTSELEDSLYSLNYEILPIDGFVNGNTEKSFIAYKDIDNNSLRMEAINIMDRFEQETIIIKYLDEPNVKKLYSDGNERPLGVVAFSDQLDNKSYIYGKQSFSFLEKTQYHYLKERKDFKNGLKIDMQMNDGEWRSQMIEDIDTEWDKLYKLMSKYNKVRIVI